MLAGVATWLVHRETLHYGFEYDDYYFLRPHTLAEVLATFHGPWDLGGVMVKFYRPLTVVLHAIRFELFGLNAPAHHAVSLTLFALAASLAGWLAYRLTGRALAAAVAALLVVAHPTMPYSLVAWVTNQMHLLQTLVVLSAFVWWHVVRARTIVWWLPLLVFGTAAFMVKEDGLMLLPAILAVHAITRRVSEPDLRPAPWVFAGAAGLLVVGLLAWRSTALGELGGYGRPTYHAAWVNFTHGLTGVFRLVPADRPWQPVASWFATLTPIVALVAWRWISAGARTCLLVGVAIAVLFNLPFVFVTKAEQMYLVGIGATLTLAGASLGMLDLAARARAPRACTLAVTALLLGGLASFVAVARDITRDFEPFGPIVLAHDDLVRTWGPVPPELREYLALKREPGAAGRVSIEPARRAVAGHLRRLRTRDEPRRASVTCGCSDRGPKSTCARARAASRSRCGIRSKRSANRRAPSSSPTGVRPTTSRSSHRSGGCRPCPLRAADVPRVSRMHRIRITIDHAWRPSEVIPGSTDERLLGLQIGELVVR